MHEWLTSAPYAALATDAMRRARARIATMPELTAALGDIDESDLTDVFGPERERVLDAVLAIYAARVSSRARSSVRRASCGACESPRRTAGGS
jgi:hypothetical protein